MSGLDKGALWSRTSARGQRAFGMRVLLAAAFGLLGTRPVAASEVPLDVEEIADGDFLVDPPAIDGPPQRTPRTRTQLHIDPSYVWFRNLSSLQLVDGTASIARFTVGGSLRLRDFELQLDIPTDVTTIHLTKTPRNGHPVDQTAAGLGDVRVGSVWRKEIPFYPPKMIVGASLTGLLSTHTTKFTVDTPMGTDKYVTPHYWQAEAAGLFATAIGPLSFITNQGFLAMLGQNITYSPNGIDASVVMPNLYFWDAHYSGAFYLADRLAISIDVQTLIQLNTVTDPPPPTVAFSSVLNDIKAVYISPGIQVFLGAFKLDLSGRLGLGSSTDTFGVMTLTGKYAAMARLTRSFDFDALGGGAAAP